MENAEQECKARLNRRDIVGWMKTIAGFANADGGKMFIGVEDKANKLIGFDRIEADAERNYLNNQINEHIYPSPDVTIRFLPYSIHGSQRYVLELTVPSSGIKPVIFKINGVPAIYMRRNGFTNAAAYEEIRRISLESTHLQYDMLASKSVYRPEEFRELEIFCQEHNGKPLTEKCDQLPVYPEAPDDVYGSYESYRREIREEMADWIEVHGRDEFRTLAGQAVSGVPDPEK